MTGQLVEECFELYWGLGAVAPWVPADVGVGDKDDQRIAAKFEHSSIVLTFVTPSIMLPWSGENITPTF